MFIYNIEFKVELKENHYRLLFLFTDYNIYLHFHNINTLIYSRIQESPSK